MTEEQHTYIVTDAIRPSYVNEDVLKDEGTKAVIISALGVRTLQTKENKPYLKGFVQVQFPSKNDYEFGFSKNNLREFKEQMGEDMRKWVGAQVIFKMATSGTYVEVVLNELPPGFKKPGDKK